MKKQDARRILLVDDHPVVRRGVAEILAEAYPAAVISELSSGAAALSSAQSSRWDLVILDLTLPDDSGLEVLKRLKKAHPKMPVLILSIHPAAQFARRSLTAGASGYLTKDAADTELTTAVARVISGGMYFRDQTIETGSGATVPPSDERPHERLSDREYEVLRMIGDGKTVSEIATGLTLSVKTVSTYRTRIMTKMGMRTNAELVHYTVRTGLMES
jgi:DNA-binding NarL/FixJ family response regulator